MSAAVRIYVITYRRPHLLERALRSLLAQTHRDWIATVLNDDPADARVAALLGQLGDPRLTLEHPAVHRGGTGNFNYAFRAVAEPFASVLEDDNWWEPGFLAAMLDALARHPAVELACGNERIWRERAGNEWSDTGRTIWPATGGEELFGWQALDKCGGARLCNSSLVFLTAHATKWRTPADIPIEVTEHFRERAVPHPFLLVNAPLVNYAETLSTHRTQGTAIWGGYQTLLVGSVFTLAPAPTRPALARALWQSARNRDPLLTRILLQTGRFVPEASDLWQQGRVPAKLRFLAGALRHPCATCSIQRFRARHTAAWSWLLRGAFADFMTRDFGHVRS